MFFHAFAFCNISFVEKDYLYTIALPKERLCHTLLSSKKLMLNSTETETRESHLTELYFL